MQMRDWHLHYVLCPTNMKAQICQSKKCSTNQRNFLLPLVAPSLPTALNNLHTKTYARNLDTHISISLLIHPSIHASISPSSLYHFLASLAYIHTFLILSPLSFSSRNHKFCLFTLIQSFIFSSLPVLFLFGLISLCGLACGSVPHSRSYWLSASKIGVGAAGDRI